MHHEPNNIGRSSGNASSEGPTRNVSGPDCNAGGVLLDTLCKEALTPLQILKLQGGCGHWSAAGLNLISFIREYACSRLILIHCLGPSIFLFATVIMVYLRYTNAEVQAAARMTETLRTWNAMPAEEEWFVYANKGWVPLDDATVGLFYDTMRKGQFKCQLPWSFPEGETLYLYSSI